MHVYVIWSLLCITGKRKTPAGTSTKSKGKAATTKCAGQERNGEDAVFAE